MMPSIKHDNGRRGRFSTRANPHDICHAGDRVADNMSRFKNKVWYAPNATSCTSDMASSGLCRSTCVEHCETAGVIVQECVHAHMQMLAC